MKTKKAHLQLFCCFLLVPSMLLGSQYDTRMRELSQPNDVTFNARLWGDEFAWQHETEDGYTIIQDRTDGYWYYATHGLDGDYVPGNYKVAIDQPVGISPHLRRVDPIRSEIQARMEQSSIQFNTQRVS